MGILRTDKISGLETPTPVTGSVYFEGTGKALSFPAGNDFAYGTDDFTIECWLYPTVVGQVSGAQYSGHIFFSQTVSGTNYFVFYFDSNGKISLYNTSSGGGSDLFTSAPDGSIVVNKWQHVALCRSGSTLRAFVDGTQVDSISNTFDFTNTDRNPTIGNYTHNSTQLPYNGYVSNFRILKGTALYTANFTVPTHELEVIGDTVLLCCNNPDSAGADGTGKTATVSGSAPASTVSPGLTRDFTYGTEFQGVTVFDTQGYFVPPSGTTEQRGRGRGIFGGAYAIPAGANIKIEYIETSSSGNAFEFGEMSSVAVMATALADSTRSVLAGGYSAPVPVNTIEFITISTTSNTTNFGDLSGIRRHMASCASNTKGVWSGGTTTGSTNCVTTLDNVTIQSLGNAVDYGDLSAARRSHGGASSPTRGVFAAGNTNTPTPAGAMNVIDYITIASGGTAQDFGDRTVTVREIGASSDSTRMVMGGGYEPAVTNVIDYVTIATTGNAQDFGDLFLTRTYANGLSNSIRGIFGGGSISPNYSNTIDYVTIQSTGNAQDFGDLNQPRLGYANAACDSHGGLS